MNKEIKTVLGHLEISPDDRFAFVRSGKQQKEFQAKDENGKLHIWQASTDDIYVSEHQLNNLKLKENDMIECTVKLPVGEERFSSAVEILKINGKPA